MDLASASPSRVSQPRASQLSPSRPGSLDQEEALWEELIRRHRGRLQARIRAALARCGLGTATDLVEELVQEVFCRLLERHGRSLSTGPAKNELVLAAYLGRMAERMVVDRVRYLAAAKRGGRRTLSLSEPAVARLAEAWPDRGPTPEQKLLSGDGWRRRWRALAGLELGERGQRYLLALMLRAIGGWTTREVAALLPDQPSAAAMDLRLHRLRHRLRRAWAPPEAAERSSRPSRAVETQGAGGPGHRSVHAST